MRTALAFLALAVAAFGAAQNTVILTPRDGTTTRSVNQGDTILVGLSFSGRTNFSWNVTGIEGSSVRLAGPTETRQMGTSPNSNMQRVFRFEAVTGGTTTVTFALQGINGGTNRTLRVVLNVSGADYVATLEDNGERIAMRTGQTLSVRLAKQAGTGYRWQIESNRARVLPMRDQGTVNSATSVGVGGKQYDYFNFTAADRGTSSLIVALIGPGGQTANLFRLEVDVDDGHAKAPIFWERDNGGSFNATVGQEFEVRLPSNPSTGYTWTADVPQGRIVWQLGSPAYEPGGSLPGAGGVQVFRFRVLRTGMAPLRLRYVRPWESGSPDKTWTLNVIAASR